MIKRYKLFFLVAICHLAFVYFLSTGSPKKQVKKIIVREFSAPKMQQKEKKIAASQRKPKKKPLPKKNHLVKREPKAINDLQKTLDKWDTLFQNVETPSDIPVKIPSTITFTSHKNVTKDYDKKLLQALKKKLILPEMGTLEISISISAKGEVSSFFINSSSSDKNAAYLKMHLPSLQLPCFNDQTNERTFTITITGR
jgi:hypothetical protein